MKKSTVFCDIDGTLFCYRNFSKYKTSKPTLIEENVASINRAYDKGHFIALTTARPEYLRLHTMKELNEANIQFHKLIMGIERGTRLLINDNESEGVDRAFAINVKRNSNFTNEQRELFNSITR